VAGTSCSAAPLPIQKSKISLINRSSPTRLPLVPPILYLASFSLESSPWPTSSLPKNAPRSCPPGRARSGPVRPDSPRGRASQCPAPPISGHISTSNHSALTLQAPCKHDVPETVWDCKSQPLIDCMQIPR
jgi:hypothetical protein